MLEVFPTRHRSQTRWFTEIYHRQRCRAWLSTEIKPDQSRLPYKSIVPEDAGVVKRLRAAGAIILGMSPVLLQIYYLTTAL